MKSELLVMWCMMRLWWAETRRGVGEEHCSAESGGGEVVRGGGGGGGVGSAAGGEPSDHSPSESSGSGVGGRAGARGAGRGGKKYGWNVSRTQRLEYKIFVLHYILPL